MMKGTSKILMVATLVMVVSLAIILALVLVLLADLYCSLLFRRRLQNRRQIPTTANTTTDTSLSLADIYSHGVIQAPRTLLFPSTFSTEHFNKHLVCMAKNNNPTSPISQTSLLLTPPHSTPSFSLQETPFQPTTFPAHFNEQLVCSDTDSVDFVYISNPIYAGTPFETPETSPSRLGGESEEWSPVSVPVTPMKELPLEACSVSLTDSRCLGSSGSYSNRNGDSSSSSLGSPCNPLSSS